MQASKLIGMVITPIFILFSLLVMTSLYNLVSAEENWYENKLEEDEHYINDFLLEAGKTKVISVNADAEVVVGFYIDITSEQTKKYLDNKITAFDVEYTIQQGDGNIKKKRFGLTGIGGCYTPQNGEKITGIKIKNNTEEDFKIVTYTTLEL